MGRFDMAREMPLTSEERRRKEAYLAHTREEDADSEALLRDLTRLARLAPIPPDARDGKLLSMPFFRSREAKGQYAFAQRHTRYFAIGMHSHAWLELLCVVRGRCNHRVGAICGRLEEGDVLLISPGTQHAFLAVEDDCLIYNLYLLLDGFEERFADVLASDSELAIFLLKTLYAGGRNSWMIFHTGAYFLGDNVLADMLRLQEEHPLYYKRRLNVLAQLFFFDLLERQTRPATRSIDPPLGGNREEILLSYVRNHSATVSVRELSRVFNYSERHITRLFRLAVGESCISYIQHCREERFLKLLVDTDMEIGSAMERAGVRGSQDFYTRFRERYGVTPAEYRRQRRREGGI